MEEHLQRMGEVLELPVLPRQDEGRATIFARKVEAENLWEEEVGLRCMSLSAARTSDSNI